MTTAAPKAPMKSLMNDARFDAWRTRTNRRLLVAANGVLGACVLASMTALYVTRNDWWIAGVIGILAVWVVATGLLNLSIRGLTELAQSQLDEREGQVRDRVYARLWWPVIAIAYAPALALVVSGAPVHVSVPVLLGCYFLTLGLPVYWLAWTLPDEPAAD